MTRVLQAGHVKDMGSNKQRARIAFLLMSFSLICQLIAGCSSSSLLPVAKGRLDSPWRSFEEAKQAYDQVVPYETREEDLRMLALSPYENANIQIISYLDLINRFMPNSSVSKEDLAPGVRGCLESHNRCYGYELTVSQMESRRYGNVILDLFNFKRKSHNTGWEFTALFMLQDEEVVYKLWRGQPNIDKYVYKRNPLGPLQSSENILQSIAVETTFE